MHTALFLSFQFLSVFFHAARYLCLLLCPRRNDRAVTSLISLVEEAGQRDIAAPESRRRMHPSWKIGVKAAFSLTTVPGRSGLLVTLLQLATQLEIFFWIR